MAWHPFRNVGLKVTALGLSTLLWLTVSGHQVTRRVPISISYSNMPAALEMTSDQDDASVLVRGDDRTVNLLAPGELRVIVDLRDAHSGANLIALRADEVVAPSAIEVLQVEPSSVTVTLERSVRKQAAVRPTLEGRPAAGFVVSDVTVEPKTVTVVGPESRLDGPIAVVTERILLDGRTSTITETVGVGIGDSQVRLLEATKVTVVVHIELERPARPDRDDRPEKPGRQSR